MAKKPKDIGDILPKGYQLKDYRIDKMLGSGGFGITYLGHHAKMGRKVAIKEYLPASLASRGDKSSVRPRSAAQKKDYAWGLKRFLDEAKTLAKFRHANIVTIYDFFEANGTAYVVMEYAEGDTIATVIKKQRAQLTEQDLKNLALSVLAGLEVVHKAQVLHRDIKPTNICLDKEGNPILIDFGSARQAMGEQSQALTSVLTPGYAPNEQYHSRGKQGPWTDIYALGAVLYHAATGKVPPEAPGRLENDNYVPAVKAAQGKFSLGFLEAIDWALEVRAQDRPQSIAAWREALEGGRIKTDVVDKPAAKKIGTPRRMRKRVQTSISSTPLPINLLALGVVILLLLGVSGYFSLQAWEGYKNRTAKEDKVRIEAVKQAKAKKAQKAKRAAQKKAAKKADEVARKAREKAAKKVKEDAARKAALKKAQQAQIRNAIAQFKQGQKYYFGRGVAKNYTTALQWFRKAAAQGHAGAQYILGVMYSTGKGVPKNHAQAVQWYRKAALQKHVDALFSIGTNYELGRGVPRSRSKAIEWYRKGHAEGDVYSKDALKRLGVSVR